MRRHAVWCIVLGLVVVSLSCGGGTFFVGANGHSVSFLTLSGTVSTVQLTITDGNVQITIVTLINGGAAQTVNFCGNVVSQFPPNTFVSVNFNQGPTCATIVQITVN